MTQFTELLKRHSLVGGILLMFLVTWPIDLANSGVLPFHVPFAIALFVGWGFIFASLVMTRLTLGTQAVLTLLRRFLIWRVAWKWYLVAFFLYPLILFSAVLMNAALTHTAIDFSKVLAYRIFGAAANLPLFILPFFLIDTVANGEEIGWRGYVLPRLQATHSALVSSLIVGVIWGLWHLPKFLAPGNTNPFGWFMVNIVADAVLYTWLYNNTKGSLLLATLFHASSNTASVFLPVATESNATILIIQVALAVLVAIGVVVNDGHSRLSRMEPRQVQA